MPNYDEIDPLMRRPDYSTGFKLKQGLQGLAGNPDLAMALLANSGYGPKRSFGEILGTSALQAQQMGSQREDDAFKRQYMQAQMAAMQGKQQGPNSVQEYEYAKQNGYKGSYEDWTKLSGQTSRPSSVQEWEFYNNLPMEQKQLYLEMKRNPNFKVNEIGGGLNVITGTPGGGVRTTQLSTLPQEATAAQTIAGAKGIGTTVGEAQGAQIAKTPAKSSMGYVIDQFRAQLPKTQQGGLFGWKGKAASVTDKQDKERYNNLREQLSTELRTAFRIPGEGTLSDAEQKQYGIQLPSVDNETQTNEQILNDIEARVQLRTETPIGAPSAPKARKRYNPATGRIE